MTTKKAEIDNIVIEDILRVFKGYNPAAQLGSGHQKEEITFAFLVL